MYMHKLSTSIATITAASMLFATGAWAQQTTPPVSSHRQPESRQMMDGSHHRASEMINHNVENLQEESLGEIQDLVFDERGEILYAVLSFGGFLGIGDKYFAVPWSALTRKASNTNIYVLDMDKDTLKNAPGFDKNQWPDTANRTWGSEIYSYYGQSQAWQEREARDRHRMDAENAYRIRATIVKKLEQEQARNPSNPQGNTGTEQTATPMEEQTGRLQLRTENGQMVEFNVSSHLLQSLEEGDSMEVVLRKTDATSMPSQAQPPQISPQNPATR